MKFRITHSLLRSYAVQGRLPELCFHALHELRRNEVPRALQLSLLLSRMSEAVILAWREKSCAAFLDEARVRAYLTETQQKYKNCSNSQYSLRMRRASSTNLGDNS